MKGWQELSLVIKIVFLHSLKKVMSLTVSRQTLKSAVGESARKGHVLGDNVCFSVLC